MSNFSNRLRKSEWYVGDCDIIPARRMIARHHYAAGAGNTAVDIHGLYRRSDDLLCGVAWWQPPTRGAASSFWTDPNEVLNLSRLVIVPEVPKNAATFLLMRSVRLIGNQWPCLITYADTMQQHTGHIYRCAGWELMGMTKSEAAYRIGGRLVSRKRARRLTLMRKCSHAVQSFLANLPSIDSG